MMSTTSDSLLPSKKRITTYGRKRTGASPALGSQDSSRKPSPSLARPTSQATRSSSRSTSPVKRLAPVEPSSSQSTNVLPSRERSENGKDGNRVVKRKQSQGQATNRQVKKQRSSSPDSAVYDIYDDIPSSPKQAPRSKPVPVKANPPRARNRVTPPKDTAMKNAAVMSPFSPATSKTLSSLSVSSRNTASTQSAQQQIPIRPPRKAPVDFGPPLAKPSKEKATEPEPRSLPAQGDARPRTRLIDALAAQAESSDSMDDSEDDEGFAALGLKRTLPSSQHADTALDSNSQSLATPSQTRTMVARESSLLSKKSGVKFTYSQERTVLAENPLLDEAGSGLDLWSQSLLPDSQPKASQMSIDEDLEDNSGAVRSLHELRQAGANNRCADEMDDLLDRIGIPSQGKPSSARRTALLELSEKIQDKAFRRQFRDHGGEPNVFNRIGKEVDLIAGYTIISILTTILASPPVPDPLLLQQLQTQGIANLFATLIAEERDISSVARDRKSNLSKHTQTTVANLKTTILNLPNLWSHPPPQLPPRTLALKCLDLIIPAHSSTMTVEHEIATSAIVDQLFEILSSAAGDAESESWDFPHSTESINLYLALNLLVKHSVPVMQSSLGPDWTSRHLPTVADILEASLLRKADKLGELDVRALKLTMNTANNNPKAPSIFLKRGVLRELAGVVCRTFGEVLHPTAGEGFKPATFDSLVLMLGVMINFAEHEPTAGRTLLESQSALQSLDNLIRIFLDNCSTTHEADSEESSQLNVLFGYLSVLLGYLSVYKPVRERFGAVQRGGNLRPLISSIQEFIAYYNKVVDHAETDNSTGRLQALVETLEHS